MGARGAHELLTRATRIMIVTDVPGARSPRGHATVPELAGLLTVACYALGGTVVMIADLDSPGGWRWVPFVALVAAMMIATWNAGPDRAWVPLAVGLAGCAALSLLADHPVVPLVAVPLVIGCWIAVRGRTTARER